MLLWNSEVLFIIMNEFFVVFTDRGVQALCEFANLYLKFANLIWKN